MHLQVNKPISYFIIFPIVSNDKWFQVIWKWLPSFKPTRQKCLWKASKFCFQLNGCLDSMGISGSWSGGTVPYFRPYCEDIPLHSRHIGLTHGRYLQFGTWNGHWWIRPWESLEFLGRSSTLRSPAFSSLEDGIIPCGSRGYPEK